MKKFLIIILLSFSYIVCMEQAKKENNFRDTINQGLYNLVCDLNQIGYKIEEILPDQFSDEKDFNEFKLALEHAARQLLSFAIIMLENPHNYKVFNEFLDFSTRKKNYENFTIALYNENYINEAFYSKMIQHLNDIEDVSKQLDEYLKLKRMQKFSTIQKRF